VSFGGSGLGSKRVVIGGEGNSVKAFGEGGTSIIQEFQLII